MTTDISWAQVATELKYEYFDRAIPHFLQQDPQSAVEKIRDQGLRRFLRVCWDAIEMRAGLTDELEEYPFTVVQGADSHPNGPWMVHFVEPKQPVELFAAVIVPEPNRNRYLTLEFFDKRNRSKGTAPKGSFASGPTGSTLTMALSQALALRALRIT